MLGGLVFRPCVLLLRNSLSLWLAEHYIKIISLEFRCDSLQRQHCSLQHCVACQCAFWVSSSQLEAVWIFFSNTHTLHFSDWFWQGATFLYNRQVSQSANRQWDKLPPWKNNTSRTTKCDMLENPSFKSQGPKRCWSGSVRFNPVRRQEGLHLIWFGKRWIYGCTFLFLSFLGPLLEFFSKN